MRFLYGSRERVTEGVSSSNEDLARKDERQKMEIKLLGWYEQMG